MGRSYTCFGGFYDPIADYVIHSGPIRNIGCLNEKKEKNRSIYILIILLSVSEELFPFILVIYLIEDFILLIV